MLFVVYKFYPLTKQSMTMKTFLDPTCLNNILPILVILSPLPTYTKCGDYSKLSITITLHLSFQNKNIAIINKNIINNATIITTILFGLYLTI